MSPVINALDLAERLSSPDIAVVDCRFALADTERGFREYQERHIPGAVYAHLDRDMSGPLAGDGTGGRHPLPSVAAFSATLGRLGIRRDQEIAIYDQDTGMFAARLWWMLRWVGHPKPVRVLNGGIESWLSAELPVEAGIVEKEPVEYDGSANDGLLVSLEEVERAVGDPSYLLLDARGESRFRGDNEPLDRAPGHIPGAVNRPFRMNLDGTSKLRDAGQLADEFGATMADISPDKRIFYCGSGVSACHNLLALEASGLGSARLYVGSFSEWSADPSRAIETGD